MNKKISGDRKIKCLGNCVDKDEQYLHPIYLYILKNTGSNNKICPSENYDKSKICTPNDKISEIQVQNYMALPYINLSTDKIIKIYDVENIDNLTSWFYNNLKKKVSFQFINRLLNIWIKNNYEIVKDFNNIFHDFYLKLLEKYYPEKKYIKNKIGDFINKWLETKNLNDFVFDLGNDLVEKFSK